MGQVDQDHELVDHLIAYKRLDPESNTADVCETIRELFKDVGHYLVDNAPRTPDRTVAIRKIHETCMASIASVVLNQEATNGT